MEAMDLIQQYTICQDEKKPNIRNLMPKLCKRSLRIDPLFAKTLTKN
jgi:hypothetical protein